MTASRSIGTLARAWGLTIGLVGALAACTSVNAHKSAGWKLAPEDPGPKPSAEVLEAYVRDLAKDGPIRAYEWEKGERELDLITGRSERVLWYDLDKELIDITETSVLEFMEPQLAKQRRSELWGGGYWATWRVCMGVTRPGVEGGRWANFQFREGRIHGTADGNPLINGGCGRTIYE